MTVHEFPPPSKISAPASGGNGNGQDLHGQVPSLDPHFQHIATKNDISNLKVWILGGVLAGIPIAAVIAITVVKVFF